jgi:Arylsulfotransferase (ASST)/Arylsulfotransferase Ig-like domain/Divergent InlB B-repeat domain
MDTRRLLITIGVIFSLLSHSASASQADTTSVSITGQQQGVTPFISTLNLTISDASVLQSIQFAITPQAGSVTRPVSATYPASYLAARGYLNSQTGQITLPVFGLYAGYSSNVVLTYLFSDGSSTKDSAVITTPAYSDPCGFNNPVVLQARTQDTDLSYDYILIKSDCSSNSPTIIDTDGAIRWVGTAGISTVSTTFFDNAVYATGGLALFRMELDGTVSILAHYSSIGLTGSHHNIDYGSFGIILDEGARNYDESANIEVDRDGNLVKTWNLADIIGATMIAGGDDPSSFIFESPANWFHNNGVTYNRSDNSVIVSSRENFVICLDYDTSVVKWILGDPTKKWHQYASLSKYALDIAPGGVPPIGQHSPSITQDGGLLLFDNGKASEFQIPSGASRNYSAPRRYQLDLQANVATETWNYTRNQSVYTPFCGSVYEDAPLNYVIDYATVGGSTMTSPAMAEIVGLNAAGTKIFDYEYPTPGCRVAWNSIPVHLENIAFAVASPTPAPTPTPSPTPAQIISPAPGSTFTSSDVTFSWAGGSATTYCLLVGSAPGVSDIFYSRVISDSSITVSNVPTDGRAIYVRLWSLVGTTGQHVDYIYTAFGQSPTPTPTPTPTATPMPTVQVTVQTTPADLAFSVDGTTYGSTQTFSWVAGSSHTVATTSPQSGGTGVQYVWTKWSDNGAISHTVAPTTTKTYTATFRTQYYLTMTHGTGGAVSPASGWKNSGAVVSISATPTNNTQVSYSFAGWTGSGSGSYSGTNNPASITMNGPITENAVFTQNAVQVTVQTNLAGLSFSVDGTTYTATQIFLWQPSSSHTIATTSPQDGGTGVRYVWTNWSGGGAISHTVAPTTNKTYTANFTTQYFLTMSHGIGESVSPTSGWRAKGSTVSISAHPANGYSFTNWTGSGTGSYSGSNNPASITISGPIAEAGAFNHN